MGLSESFSACSFAPASEDRVGNPTLITPSPIGTWKTTSFFIDSSGRSSFSLPLQLSFSSKEDVDGFLAANCLNPPPSNLVRDDNSTSPECEASVGFEVKSYSVDELKPVVVEGVTIKSTWVKGLAVGFETEVTVRAADHRLESPDGSDDGEGEPLDVLTNLEIVPVLTIKKAGKNDSTTMDVLDLLALELGAIPDHMQKESSARLQESRLASLALNVTLTHAFTISVNSVQGTSMGHTLVSLAIRHSNSHSEKVTISNIALHPGHSRYEVQATHSLPGGHYSITNMTKSVQWGFVDKTELQLPLTLAPNDAYSTILMVNAGEEMHSRSFISPVSVTGIVGVERQRVVVASDAHWSTELVAVEPADAFRITMSVSQSEVRLGEPLTVALRIFNLSLETRDLMLLMAKDDHMRSDPKDEAVNSAIVSEVNGYTFGVFGISPEDDGTTRLVRDNELLAVDAALLPGEILGQHAVDVEIRFVPLCEGTLQVPNWKLYDKTAGIWYTCVHNLSIVATANSST